MPARKAAPTPAPVDSPPGPISVEVRAGPPGQERVVWRQRVHGRPTIDDQGDKVVITAVLRVPAE